MPEVKQDNWELVSQFNPVVGCSQWKLVESDYDYAQEISRSGYGDMLHDSDRNLKYNLAIQKAVAYRRRMYPSDSIRVLDIGTGTGLLAMMAVKADADCVTACEAFLPVAECAEAVLKANGFWGKVHIIKKSSTKLVVGSDMNERANMLVAELLDTELIGEGCLSTYRHAAECLLTDDATLVPYAADLFVQVVESPFLWSHHCLSSYLQSDAEQRLSHFESPLGPFHDSLLNNTVLTCSGAPSVMDIQASELDVLDDDTMPLGDRQLRCLLSEPVRVKRFQFGPPIDQIKLEESLCITSTTSGERLVACRSGIAHAFVVWWRLKMEPTNTVPDISTAPKWSNDPDWVWRDHWMQAVYFPRQAIPLCKGEPLGIRFSHDSLSLWFDLTTVVDECPNAHCTPNSSKLIERPVCECGMHYAWSRNRIAHLNSESYRSLTGNILEQVQSVFTSSPESSMDVVIVSDCTLLPLLIASSLLSSKCEKPVTIYHLESSPCSARFLHPVYDSVKSKNVKLQLMESVRPLIEEYKHRSTSVLVLLAEPYAAASILPWDCLHFWYVYRQFLKELSSSLPNIVLLCPTRLRIMAVLVEFVDLWKIRAPVGRTCGQFDLTAFDNLVQKAMLKTDAVVEPQPLWEYPSWARSFPTVVFSMNLNCASKSDVAHTLVTVNQGTLRPSAKQPVNGIALWAEWLVQPGDSDANHTWYAPAGPCSPILPGTRIRWSSTGAQQGVMLTPNGWFPVTPNESTAFPSISLSVDWDCDTGEHKFTLKVPEDNSS
ncbi:type III protein arginine methyltransferase [Paragonimus westermani]|uniref:Type III protein arginine methyltransferase n=1 Tax=Paragonimus westermani TaxID=34504 RepID=A0A5J4NM45_9TREM|nr:type III protein arginine methyltransferase [Paragonimus westermani]